ncbi:MAG TPA: YgcG family protein [Burkholderiaceae bacterium]|jgi:uncharacterized protein
MKSFLAALLWLLCAGALATPDSGQIAVPPLHSRVTDATGTLTAAQQEELEHELANFEKTKGSQLAVLIVPTTGQESIEQYSLRVVEQWKLGRQKVDDGVLLIVAKNDHAMRMEVGYGLEGVLPDVVCERIISEIIAPKFKTGDFYGGIHDGVDKTIAVVGGEALPEAKEKSGAPNNPQFPFVILVVVLMVGRVLRRVIGRLPGALVTGVLAALVAWSILGAILVSLMAAALAFAFTLLGGGLLLPMAGLGGSGSGGGGGFSGGGGSFGGGGASGRW